MATFSMPTSYLGLLAMLEQCVITGGQDKARGKPLIDDVVLGNITTFLTDWGPLVRQMDIKQAGRSKETRESGSAVGQLETYIRDAWVVEKRRIVREGLPPEVLLYYGLDMNAELPHSGTRAQLLQWGKTIVDGDAAAVLAGHEAIANPSALQVKAKLTAAQTEADQVAMRDRDFDETQQAASTGRPAPKN